jgi:hypothetical protein
LETSKTSYDQLRQVFNSANQCYDAGMGFWAVAHVIREKLLPQISKLAIAKCGEESLEARVYNFIKGRENFFEWGSDHTFNLATLNRIAMSRDSVKCFVDIFDQASLANPELTLEHLVFAMASVRNSRSENLAHLFWHFFWLLQRDSNFTPPPPPSQSHPPSLGRHKRASSNLSDSSQAPAGKTLKMAEAMDEMSLVEMNRIHSRTILSPLKSIFKIYHHLGRRPSILSRKESPMRSWLPETECSDFTHFHVYGHLKKWA